MRPWIVSAVAVAILVAGTLAYLDRDDEGGGGGSPRVVDRTPSQVLTEADVRQYLVVMPQLNAMLGRIAEEYQRRALAGTPDDRDFGAYSQQRISELLAQNHLTRESFEKLRRRVEHVVDVLRYEEELDQRHRELDEKIAEKERHRDMMKESKTRRLLEQDIAEMKRQRAEPPPPVNPADRELVKSFWRDLQRAVPRTAPPLPEEGQGGATRPPR